VAEPSSTDPGGIWPTRAGYVPPARLTAPDRKPPSDDGLLRELWLISHFGWIAETAIRRALIISDAHEILADSLTERLRQLRNREWVEQRYSDLGTGELEWRLTDTGRDALR
jgi:hypothetical protein